MKLKHAEIEFDHIGGIFGQVLLPDAISQRSIKYDTNIFITHIGQMMRQSKLAANQFRGTDNEKKLLFKVIDFGQRVGDIGTKYQNIFDTLSYEKRTATNAEKKKQLTQDRVEAYRNRDDEIFHEIYAFIQDEEVKSILTQSAIDTSFLPTEEEWSKNDPFRYPLFNHVRKANGLQKDAQKRAQETKKAV